MTSETARVDQTPLSIGADGLDVDALVGEIREKVEEGRREGRYDEDLVAWAERHNLFTMQDRPDFVRRYLACMRQAAVVDINDFIIVERRKRFSGPLVFFKSAVWKMLRFYTYRLWSQQNQVNGVLLAALEMIEDRYRKRIEALEEKVRELEDRASANKMPATRTGPDIQGAEAGER